MIQSLPKPPKIKQDEARLDFVRQKYCLIVTEGLESEIAWVHAVDCTTEEGREAHHVRKGAHAGTGRKPPASRTIPLCAVAHREYHELGHDTFCAKYGLDLEAHLQRINAEFARIHKRKPAREPRQKTSGLIVKRLKAWAVVNELGNIQDVSFSKAAAKASPREYVVRVEIREVR